MKILISSDGMHAHWFIRLGLAKAFQACGHQVAMWDINSKPAYDVFDEFQPDLFIGQTYNLNEHVINCLTERPYIKVIMKGSDWGEKQKEIDLTRYPVLVTNDNEIKLVGKLRKSIGKPDFIHCHYHPNRIQSTHGYWTEKLGIPVVGLMSGADISIFHGGKYNEALASDITFVGGYWGYKSQTLNKWLLPLCNPQKPYKIRIFGNSGWPCPQFCGFISDDNIKDILASATICPNISEPHSQDFGYDIIERPWKLLSNKCFCISDYVDSMAKDVFTNDELVFANSPKEFEELILHFLKYPNERLPYIERGYKTVIDNHTYFSRIKIIFENLHMKKEVVNVDSVYAKVKENL